MAGRGPQQGGCVGTAPRARRQRPCEPRPSITSSRHLITHHPRRRAQQWVGAARIVTIGNDGEEGNQVRRDRRKTAVLERSVPFDAHFPSAPTACSARQRPRGPPTGPNYSAQLDRRRGGRSSEARSSTKEKVRWRCERRRQPFDQTRQTHPSLRQTGSTP